MGGVHLHEQGGLFCGMPQGFVLHGVQLRAGEDPIRLRPHLGCEIGGHLGDVAGDYLDFHPFANTIKYITTTASAKLGDMMSMAGASRSTS